MGTARDFYKKLPINKQEQYVPEKHMDDGEELFDIMEDYAKKYASELQQQIDILKPLAHEGLPDDCLAGLGDVKFCDNRQGEGNQCKQCSHYK